MSRDHVLERVERDAEGEILVLLDWRVGVVDSPANVAMRTGRYVRLTERGQRALEAANRLRRA